MSLIDLTTHVISQCDDLRLAIDVDLVVREAVQFTEARLLEDELAESGKRLADTQLEFKTKNAEALSQQRTSLQNINRMRELKTESARAAAAIEDSLKLNSKRILSGYNGHRNLLLRHIRLKSDASRRWECISSRILENVMAFADQSTISSCSVVCNIWRHNLQFSNVYYQALMQKILRSRSRKIAKPDLDHRIAIRIYLSNDNGSSSIAFDKSLAQLQSENERVAAEHEDAISRLRQAEFQVTELQNKIKSARQRFGMLSIARSEQMEELQNLANRKKLLVSQTGEMDRKLADRRFQNMETYLQLQDEMQQQVAESRRLDAVDQELKRLSENFELMT